MHIFFGCTEQFFNCQHLFATLSASRINVMGDAMEKSLFIRAEWDEEAEVWVATSDDVPGLVAEADTAEALLTKLHILIPELLDANGYPDTGEVPFEVFSRRFDVAYRQIA
jgi:predicted RNase H-like HicB family nuclease